MLNRLALVSSVIVFLSTLILPADASNPEKAQGARRKTASILISASPEIVWRAIHEQRANDPEMAYTKVLSRSGNHLTLEQKFTLIPIIGTATCLMSNDEVPFRRIDYKLLKSDRFKSMEGSWILQPIDRKCTLLELSSQVDVGIPGARCFVESAAPKKLKQRLERVKQAAESIAASLAKNDSVEQD